jgi:succinyl-CoA synthetase beta subunit
MDLLEYQVKEWFKKMGIPVLPSQTIDHPTDLKRLKISYPIVLKSQVYADERAKAGGVRVVETTIDAIAAAQNIFHLPIWGELPEVLLAECKYDAQEEVYLAVVLDTALCRPVLLGCKELNIDWDTAGDKMQYVIVEQEFSPFYARRLALKMGLQGALMQSVSGIIEKMYQLFEQKDLDLVEINPLAISSSGQLMALNGKIRINERAINRHPDIVQMAKKLAHRQHQQGQKGILANWESPEKQGKIGIVGNGTGSVLTTLDAVVDAGGKPGMCLNLRHTFVNDSTPTTFSDGATPAFSERLKIGLQTLAAAQSMPVILINFLGTIPQVEQMPEAIAQFLQQNQSLPTNGSKNQLLQLPRLVIRLTGSEFNCAREYLTFLNIANQGLVIVENLEVAVETAVSLAKLPFSRKY